MDAEIKNGDVSLYSFGDTVRLFGDDELLQRVKIAGTVRKGSFVYNKELGNEAYKIEKSDEKALKTAQLLLSEALAQIPNVQIKATEITVYENNSIAIKAEVSCNGSTKEITLVM